MGERGVECGLNPFSTLMRMFNLYSDLDHRVALLVSYGTDNSRKSYARAVSRFVQFCVRYELDPFRVNESTILRFIAHLSSTISLHPLFVSTWLV